MRSGLRVRGSTRSDDPSGEGDAPPTLAKGLLKHRSRAHAFVFAPDRLRPKALREMLSRLSPYCFSLAPPNAVRDAIYRHFAFTRQAIEGLASRHPSMSAGSGPLGGSAVSFFSA